MLLLLLYIKSRIHIFIKIFCGTSNDIFKLAVMRMTQKVNFGNPYKTHVASLLKTNVEIFIFL